MHSRITYGAGPIGIAQEALRIAIEWAKERTTFGVRLADRQAVQWEIADSEIELRAARLLIYQAGWKADLGEDVRVDASIAKLYSTEAAFRVVEEFLAIGWDARRLREGRTFLAPEVGLVAGIATAMEDIHARHRAVLEAALRRGLTDRTLPAAAPERDAFAIHAVALRCLEMRARGRLDRSYRAARDEIIGLFLPEG